MPKSPKTNNGFIPSGNQLARTIVAPEKLSQLSQQRVSDNPYQNYPRDVRVPQVKQNGKVVQKASVIKRLPPVKSSTPISKPIKPTPPPKPKTRTKPTNLKPIPYSHYKKPEKPKQAPIKFELPPINMKKEKPLEEGFDHIISLGETYSNAIHIEEAGLTNQTYVFDMVSNLTLNKAPALIHPKLHAHTLFMEYNVKTQKTRLHNLEIPHLANEEEKNITKKLKQYYEMKLNELQAILLSGKRVLFVHRAIDTDFKHKHYVHEFINQITERYPGLDFHILTCNYTNTTNTRHTNVFVKTTREFIQYLKDNIRVTM